MHHPAISHDREVVTFEFDIGLAKRNQVLFIGDFALDASVKILVLEEDDRVVVTDR